MMKTSHFYLLLLFSASALFLTGCGTIMNGTYQKIGVSSSPTGATVVIDGVDVGKTPVILDLKRKDDHTIRFTLDGYVPFEMPIIGKVSNGSGGILFLEG